MKKQVLCAFIAAQLISGISLAAASPAPFVELDRTNQFVELALQFAGSDARLRVKVQDGVMNTLAADGGAPVQFVVKVMGPADIRYFPVSELSAEPEQGRPGGLRVGQGINILASPSPQELERAGIKTISYIKSGVIGQ